MVSRESYRDCKSLNYLVKLESPANRLSRWLLELSNYDFIFEHIKGSDNFLCDLLSRDIIDTVSTDIPDIDVFKSEQRKDPNLRKIIDYLENKTDKSNISTDSYFMDKGMLKKISYRQKRSAREDYLEQIIVPTSLIPHVLEGSKTVHYAFFKIYRSIQEKYYWKNMYKDIKKFSASCKKCIEKKGFKLTKSQLQNFETPSQPMELLSLDILGPLPMSEKGNRYILGAIDHFSKYSMLFALSDITAKTIASKLMETIQIFGIPHSILTDLGTNFQSKLFTELAKELQINKLKTTPYRPQTNGVSERAIFAHEDLSIPLAPEIESTGSKELDKISSEIKELQMEKMTLEKDLAQKEADVKIKNGELKNAQNELDALETVLKQLEIQKGEARKRLNDLDKQIEAMKKQKEEQEVELQVQEKELNEKRKELNELRQEESKLESQISSGKSQLDALTNSLQSTKLQISQMKLKIEQIQEQHRLMSEAIKDMDNAVSFGDFRNVSEFALTGFAPITDETFSVASPTISKSFEANTEPAAHIDSFQDDPFKSSDPFEGKTNGFASDPFAGEDPFKAADPFQEGGVASSGDPFAGADPFDNAFGVTAAQTTKDDPFLGSDPFGGFTAPANPEKDPFDPFGLTKSNSVQSPVAGFDADPFGADPFQGSSAAPPRPESPTPALPPKKSKAPPPRPAPPKVGNAPAKPGPTRAAPAPPVPAPPNSVDPFKASGFDPPVGNTGFPDLFAGKSGKTQDAFDPFSNPAPTTGDGFANFDNFADFDNIK
ncbi:hypothetical protein JTE90_026073 [Oedothorax gibbosus]|uniref:RNA-directed DNA polymerase n=1 Tax=Oedothorax gibbosus TaxID=931172 RepID=A0AAV6TWX4_9ARAC|nr:hypothetical protein JTE90_026073 [Oedothorax gibbosus]